MGRGNGKDKPRKKDAAGKKRPSGKSGWLKYNQARKAAQAGALASATVSKRRRLIQHDIVRVERKKRTVATQTDGAFLGCKESVSKPEMSRNEGVDSEDSSGYDGDIDDRLVDALGLTRSRARANALARSA
eukprot:s1668_g9.t1